MSQIVSLNLFHFSLVYLLLTIVLVIMKKCQINQTKLLLLASFRMSIQLFLAGLVLTYIFQHPHPLITVFYLLFMSAFAVYMVLAKNKGLNKTFKIIVGLSLSVTGLAVVAFFIIVVVNMDIFNPQYAIPISGMVIGNAVNGVSLGLKTFSQSVQTQRIQIDTLLNLGVTPQKILMPFVNQAVETALLPTLNSMLGMGIISLPGMMTGQILSGTLPMTAILYQTAIMIALCTVTCAASFCAIYFGAKTLYNERCQIVL